MEFIEALHPATGNWVVPKNTCVSGLALFISKPGPGASGVVRRDTATCVYISGGQKYDRKFVMTIIVFSGDAILGWLKTKNPECCFVFTDSAVQERLRADGLSFSVVKLYVGDMYFISAGCLHCIISERSVLHSCVGWKTVLFMENA